MLAAIWIAAGALRLPVLFAPWHGLDRELLTAPTAALRTLDDWSRFQLAPGEFLGWWSLAEQRRYRAEPLSFRLVNFFLVFALVLFFPFLLTGEELQELDGRKNTSREILLPLSLFAFHPFLNDLIANAFTRPVLLAAFWAGLAFLLLRRALTGERERPLALGLGTLCYLVALGSHPISLVVLAGLVRPILFQAQRPPRNWAIMVLLVLVSLVDLAIGFSLGAQPENFLQPGFLTSLPAAVRTWTLAAAFFPPGLRSTGWFLPPVLAWVALAFAALRAPASRPSPAPHWFWSLSFLVGILGPAFALWQLPGIYLAGPVLFAWLSYTLLNRLRLDSVSPEVVLRAVAMVVGAGALSLLCLSSARGWAYYTESGRGRDQLAAYPEWPLAWQNLGLALLAEHQAEAGKAWLSRGAARFPDDLALRLAQVETEIREGKLAEAAAWLENLAPTAGEQWEVIFYFCAVKSLQGELAEAGRYCQEAVRLRPASAPALNYLAALDLRRQQWPAAEGLLRQAFRYEPRNPAVLNNLGYVMEQKGDPEQAFAYYRQAVEMAPDHPLYLKNLARAYFKRRQTPEAVAALEAVLRSEPRDLETRVNLAKIYYQMGDQRRALVQINAVLKLAPHSPEAAEMLELERKISTAPEVRVPGQRLR